MTFERTDVAGATKYKLFLGNTPGASDIQIVFMNSTTTKTATGLPTDGRTIYAQLRTEVGGVWLTNDYTFTAAGGVPDRSELVSPPDGSTFTSDTVTFERTDVAGATKYKLFLGNTPGASDIQIVFMNSTTIKTATGLPTDGRTIYAQLRTEVGGVWLTNDYTFTAHTQ